MSQVYYDEKYYALLMCRESLLVSVYLAIVVPGLLDRALCVTLFGPIFYDHHRHTSLALLAARTTPTTCHKIVYIHPHSIVLYIVSVVCVYVKIYSMFLY